MHDGETVDGSTVRWATAGVVTYSLTAPLMTVVGYLQYPYGPVRPWVAVLMLGAAPLLAWLARAVTRAPFTRAQLMVLGAASAMTSTVAVVGGPPRWTVLYVPAALVAVTLPRVWPAVFLVGLVAVAGVVAVAGGQPNFVLFYAVGMLIGVSPLVVSIRLVRSVRQLRAAREELAAQAIARERARIDEDLTAVVGRALADLAGRADGATRLLDTDPAAADGELRTLVADARRTLADARRVVRGYRDVSLGAELETAAALLAAAGIPARVEPGGSAGTPADRARRTALRQEVARILETGSPGEVVLTGRDRRPGAAPREPE